MCRFLRIRNHSPALLVKQNHGTVDDEENVNMHWKSKKLIPRLLLKADQLPCVIKEQIQLTQYLLTLSGQLLGKNIRITLRNLSFSKPTILTPS